MEHFAKKEVPPANLVGWAKIAYSYYWDFARIFAVNWNGFTYVLVSDFLEDKDENSDFFETYRTEMVPESELANALKLPRSSLEFVKSIPVSAIVFDMATRKTYLKLASLDDALRSS